jgi:hypothetical protein
MPSALFTQETLIMQPRQQECFETIAGGSFLLKHCVGGSRKMV